VELRSISIADGGVFLDRKATLDIMIALSELHGRLCDGVSRAGDMGESDRLAAALPSVTEAHYEFDQLCNQFRLTS